MTQPSPIQFSNASTEPLFIAKMRRLKMSRLCMIAVFFCIPMSEASANMLDDIQGYYTAPSTSCSYLEGDKLVSCGDDAKDCLMIKKLTDETAEIQVSSAQTNLHICNASGTATLQGNSLVLLDPESSEEDPGQGLKIEIGKHKLVLGYTRPIKGWHAPFCGARAYLSKLEFSRKLKKSSGPECSSE